MRRLTRSRFRQATIPAATIQVEIPAAVLAAQVAQVAEEAAGRVVQEELLQDVP